MKHSSVSAFLFSSIGGLFSSLLHKPILTLFAMPVIHWENAIEFGLNAVISGSVGLGFKYIYDNFLTRKTKEE